jgi:nucleoside-diphosphate-sugar epimerase
MNSRILITGSSGLVGGALRTALESVGNTVAGLDILGSGEGFGDVRNAMSMKSAFEGCTGVIHLAAVSRVIWGERDPDNCWATNVEGLKNVLQLAQAQKKQPWLVFASSREVYGQPDVLPATEDSPLNPVNIYGRAKVEGERLINEAREKGLRAVIIRLSNVYGSTMDHHDRVVPAFARAAVLGQPMRVDGAGHTFDFTHLDDTVRGIVALAGHLEANYDALPPIHFLTGQATSLGQLAGFAQEITGFASEVLHAPPRNFDVSTFHGSPLRARNLLGWEPRISIKEGLVRLIDDYRAELMPKSIMEAVQ